MTGKKKSRLDEAARKVVCELSDKINYSTMNGKSSLQMARNFSHFNFFRLHFEIMKLMNRGLPFKKARKKVFEWAVSQGDVEFGSGCGTACGHIESIKFCLPELSETEVQSLLKWEKKRAKKMNEQGRTFFNNFGKAQQLTNRAIPCPSSVREECPEDWKAYDATFSTIFRKVEREASGRHHAAIPRSFSRARSPRRSHVRPAAASSSGDSGDGESDQGDPPRPSLTVPPLHFPLFSQKLNSFLHPWVSPSSRWSMSGRWAA